MPNSASGAGSLCALRPAFLFCPPRSHPQSSGCGSHALSWPYRTAPAWLSRSPRLYVKRRSPEKRCGVMSASRRPWWSYRSDTSSRPSHGRRGRGVLPNRRRCAVFRTRRCVSVCAGRPGSCSSSASPRGAGKATGAPGSGWRGRTVFRFRPCSGSGFAAPSASCAMGLSPFGVCVKN